MLGDFLDLRESLRSAPTGEGGIDVCAALTSSLDEAVGALTARIDPSRGLAVVATGGYGRAELSLFSDVDLMVLHETGDPAEAAAALFRPLWDAGLRVGHSVRTVKEATSAARERFDTFTTLLTSRLVAGDAAVFDRLTSDIATVTRARPLRRYLVGEERERRRLSPYLQMATDVKAGRGGLRTLQGFEWERRREALIGRFSAPEEPGEAEANETLLMIRNALHAVAGRSYDVFAFDLREAVARWLGMDVYEVSERLVRALQIVDRLADRRWPEIYQSGDSLARRVWNRLTDSESGGVEKTRLSPGEFASVLRSGDQGRMTLEALWSSGRLQDLMPEWEAVSAAPQLAPFHEHPVDAHLWRTVDEMQALVDGDDTHYAGIAAEVGDADVLTLAAFLHDIGKARGGDHARVGAKIARSICDRLGCDDEVARLVEGAVRHHLILSETATRRDLDDPAVVAEVGGVIGDLRLLDVIYLLTVADSRATGATMWNEWKATLVRTLYRRCSAHLEAAGSHSPMTGTTREELLAGVGEDLRSSLESHLDAMPVEYLRGTPLNEVLWHLGLIEGLESVSDLGVRAGEAAESAVVVGRGRPGFRRVVAESFAAHGIDVLEARMATRADGIIVDAYKVRDDRTGGSVPSERWGRARSDIEAALSGELDTGSKVAARAEAYSSVAPARLQPEVRISIDDASDDGVVTVRCSDRVGRLAEILTVLTENGLEIRLAKLDSRQGEVVDTFHVRRDALPVDPPSLESLRVRIQSSVRP